MRGRRLYVPNIYYAAIDPGGGGGAAPGATGGAPTPNAQPGGQGGGQGGFRETFFQNVPDELWGQMEPHLNNVNRHVTQLQQRYAPFSSYRDEDLQGLADFSSAFERDPVGQWIRMAQGLQNALGPNGQPILNPDLDLEHLAALVRGELGEEEPPGGPQLPPQNGDVDMPPWAQQIMQKVEALEGGFTQDRVTRRQQVEDAVLKNQTQKMREQLTEGGFPEDALTEELLLSTYIAHRGNINAAAQSLLNMRMAMLKGFTNPNDPNPTPTPRSANNDLDLPNGAPTPRQGRQQRGRRSSIISPETRAGALQFLKQQDKT